jgi:hypothetical protein
MRTVVLLLIAANVLLFGYARFDRAAQSEANRLGLQVQPERIRVLTSQQVAALGPAKVAALPDVCVEWGPFTEADRARAQADLEPLALGRLLSQRPLPAPRTQGATLSWLVVRDPPQPAVARMKELQAQYPGSDLRVGPCGPS